MTATRSASPKPHEWLFSRCRPKSTFFSGLRLSGYSSRSGRAAGFLRRFLWLGWALSGWLLPQAHAVSFPAGSGLVIDVTEHGVVGDGVTDVTGPLQALVDTYKGNAQVDFPRILYFPNGTYLLSDSIVGTLLDGGSGFGWMILQGESEAGTVLKLADNAPGFADPANPKPLLLYFGGNWSNNVFGNALENLTVDVGSGNPGATAVAFFCNNFGWVRNVTLRTSGASPQGSIGLDLGYRGPNGIGLIEGLTVEGFRIGINNVGHSQMMPWIFDDIRLLGQTEVGLLHDVKPMSIRRVYSENTVPAIRMTGSAGMMSILDSEFVGGTPGTPAILVDESMDFNERRMRSGHVLIRNIKHSGYGAALQVNGQLVPGDFSRSTYRTQKISAGLWENRPEEFLSFEVPAVPEVAAGDPAEWFIVDPAGRTNHTELLREAFFSGAETIVLKPGAYVISDTIRVGPDVRKVMGQLALLTVTQAFAIQEKPIFLIEESRHPAVHIEKLYANWGGQGDSTARAWAFHNASTADLVLQDIFWPTGPFFRNDFLGRGRVFLRNIHSLPGGQNNLRKDISAFVFEYQRVWAWQLNPEMHMPHVTNRGSDFWLFGFKFGEREGPFLKASRHSRTEILTGGMNMTDEVVPPDAATVALLEVEDSTVTGMFFERASYEPASGANGWGFHPVVLRETRNGVLREITHTADGTDISNYTNHQFSDPTIVRRPSHRNFLNTFGAYIGFLATGYDPQTPNAPPEVSVSFPSSHSFGTPLNLDGTMVDPDAGPGPLLGFWSKIEGPGRVFFDDPETLVTQATFSQPGLYTLRWTARDGVSEVFAEQAVAVVWDEHTTLYGVTDATVVDNAKDGLGDSWVGPGNDTYGQVANFRRFVMNFDIRSFIGQDSSIETATLRLTTMGHNGGNGSVEVYSNTDGYGVMNNGDYQTPSTLISTFGGPYTDGSVKNIDITAALQAALAAGKPYLEIRLQRIGAGSEWDWVRFYGRSAEDAARRPHLLIATTEAEAPTELLVEQRGPSAFLVTWAAASSNDASYRIERSEDGGAFAEIATLPHGTFSFLDEDVAPGSTYRYRVIAVNAHGASTATLSQETSLGNNAPVATEVALTGRVAVQNTIQGQYLYENSGNQNEAGSTFRWLIADQPGGLFTALPEATALSFTPPPELLGRTLVFEVTPASAGALGVPVLSAPQKIGGPLVPPQALHPEIYGLALVGNTLYGGYMYYDDNGDPPGASTYRWLISDSPTVGYAPIPEATSRTLEVLPQHVGKYLLFEVTPISLASPEVGNPVTTPPIFVPSAGMASVAINFFNDGGSFQIDPTLAQGPATFTRWTNFKPRTDTARYKSFASSTGLLHANALELQVIGDRLTAILEQETPTTPEQQMGYGYLFFNANGEALRLENIGETFDLSHGYTLYLITGNTAGSSRTYTYTLSTGASASTTGTMANYESWAEATNFVQFQELQENDITLSVNSPDFNKVGLAGIQIVGVPLQGPSLSSSAPLAHEVAVEGSPQVGMTLEGQYHFQDPGGSTEDGSTFRWLIGPEANGAFQAVPSATGSSFPLLPEHANSYLIFEVTPRNAEGASGNPASSVPVRILSSAEAQVLALGINFTAGNISYRLAPETFAGPASNPQFARWNNLTTAIANGGSTSLQDSDGEVQSGITLVTQGALRNMDNGSTGSPIEQMGHSFLEWNAHRTEAVILSGLGSAFALAEGYTVYVVLGTDAAANRTLQVTYEQAATTRSMTGSVASFAAWEEGVNFVKFEGLQTDTLTLNLASPFWNKLGIGGIQIVGRRLPPPSAFSEWQSTHFADPAAPEAAPLADPDGDGYPNIMEYALGGNPHVAHTVPLPQLGWIEVEGQTYLTFSIARNPAATDIEYLVQTRTDLLEVDGWLYGDEHIITIEEEPDWIHVRTTTPLVEDFIRFMRLAIRSLF